MSKQPNPPPPGDKPVPTAPPPPPAWRHWVWPLAILATLVLFEFLPRITAPQANLSYSQFISDVNSHKVKDITFQASTPNTAASGTLRDGSNYTTVIPGPPSTQLTSQLAKEGVAITAQASSASLGTELLWFIVLLAPLFLAFYLFRRLSRGGGAGQLQGVFGAGRSKAKVFDAERPETKFSDVAGYEGVKAEIAEVVDFLRSPGRYQRAGAMAPRGVLMIGPPGTGKTLLARAVAGEASVPFFSVTGSSFVEMFVGVGAARVRDLFSEARKRSPAIIFVDEVDAIGQRRAGSGAMVANDEREQTLNQLLAVHCRGKKLAGDVDLNVIARGTPGFSGADLANLANEAAIFAVRGNREVLTATDFDDARDRILLGRREGSNVLLPEEKHAVAVHEAGHALVAALSKNADPVAKVTILPAGQALGVTQQLPLIERHLYGEDYLHDSLAVRLGGRAAELVELGQGSTGAANDLSTATDIATRMVREFGLSAALGPVGYPEGGSVFLGGGGSGFSSRPFAESTQATIDAEVARLLREAEQTAIELIRSHKAELDQLVRLLLDRETVDGADVYRIAGRPVPQHRPAEVIAPHTLTKAAPSAAALVDAPAAAASAGSAPGAPAAVTSATSTTSTPS